jgi:hypothetical protein
MAGRAASLHGWQAVACGFSRAHPAVRWLLRFQTQNGSAAFGVAPGPCLASVDPEYGGMSQAGRWLTERSVHACICVAVLGHRRRTGVPTCLSTALALSDWRASLTRLRYHSGRGWLRCACLGALPPSKIARGNRSASRKSGLSSARRACIVARGPQRCLHTGRGTRGTGRLVAAEACWAVADHSADSRYARSRPPRTGDSGYTSKAATWGGPAGVRMTRLQRGGVARALAQAFRKSGARFLSWPGATRSGPPLLRRRPPPAVGATPWKVADRALRAAANLGPG